MENILVVSDLHFGEELLPGASVERRGAIELGATAFRDFLAHHAQRRHDGRPWRLVIAGDLFDFMSVRVGSVPDRPAKTKDERIFGLGRSAKAGIERMRILCKAHAPMLEGLAKFAAAGHYVDVIAGNHDVELLVPDVAAEFLAHFPDAVRDRIRVIPWFLYVPGVAWIEHGHVYDEGCSFEMNLAPFDPKDGNLIFNADYAAVRYLGMSMPDIDPHGIESWSFWGFLRYAAGQGVRSAGRIWSAYGRFVYSLFRARHLHRSIKRRERRRREHQARLVEAARDGGISVSTAQAIDHFARMPLTSSVRRLGRLLMLDRLGLVAGVAVVALALLILLPIGWALLGVALATAGAAGISKWLGEHLVTSQLPMRAIPQRIRKLVDAPVVVFGHTHDPRMQRLRSGGTYVNSGTWLPATRPGLRRCFTHAVIEPRTNAPPFVELRQWRDGTTQPFDARANLGAGVTTLPGLTYDEVG